MYWVGMLASGCYLYEPRQVWNNRVIKHTLFYPDVVLTPTTLAVLISVWLPFHVVESRVEHSL